MAITLEAFTGSAVTISTAEISMLSGTSTLQNNAVAGIYQAFIDLNSVAAADIFEFRVYETTITGGTKRLVYYARFANAQATPIFASPTLMLGIGWDMTLIKASGTDRALTWRVSKVA
jgi:hypothetical protein